jgi:hypothetical protein
VQGRGVAACAGGGLRGRRLARAAGREAGGARGGGAAAARRGGEVAGPGGAEGERRGGSALRERVSERERVEKEKSLLISLLCRVPAI